MELPGAKDFSKSKRKSSNRKSYHHRNRSANTPQSHGDGPGSLQPRELDEDLSCSSEDEGGGVPQRRLGPDGQVLPISKGLNLEELLMEAQYSHNEAGFRFRGMLQEELSSCAPELDPSVAAQALTLDLDALAASLARLPLQQLLGLPPAHAGWLAQEESARGLAKADLLHQPLPEPKWRRDPPHPPIGKPTQAAQQAPPPPPVPARPQPVQQPHPPPVRAQHQPPAPQPPQPQPQLQQQSAHAHDEELDMLLGLSGPPTLPVPASTQAASTPALTPCQPPVHVQSVGLVGGTGTTSSAVHPYQPPVHVQSVGLVGGPGTTSSAIHPKPPSALPLLRSSAVPTVPRYPQQPQLPQQPQQHRHDDELDELLGL